MADTSVPLGYLFDMDGLLLDTERVGLVSFQKCLTLFGFEAKTVQSFYLSLIGGSKSDTITALEGFLPESENASEFYLEWWAEMDRRLLDHVPLRPYASEVLASLNESNKPMAVVTSTVRDRAHEKLDKAGILKFFKGVVAGDDVSLNKPDPAPYLMGAEVLGLSPDHCAAFEDSDTGIMSAVRAGTMAVQIPDLRPEDAPLPALGQRIGSDLRVALALC